MFDENQLVEVKWANKTKQWFIDKGYEFTKYNDSFFVKAKDLSYGSKFKVKVICDYCGNEYETPYNTFMKRDNKLKDCCAGCKVLKQYETNYSERAKNAFDKLRKFCNERNYKLLTDESEYTDSHMVISYICEKHGVQYGTLTNMISGHGCIHCSYENGKRAEKYKMPIEYVVKFIEDYNDNKLLNPKEYINSSIYNLKILCSCGNIFTTSFYDYVNNSSRKCKTCSHRESIGERRIRNFLEDKKINFIQEKRFDDCRDTLPLPFDFYLPNYNLIIEFDGQHHFEDGNSRFNKNNIDKYKKTKKHDEIKNQYCKSHGIDLLRISYLDGDDIENIIKTKLNL